MATTPLMQLVFRLMELEDHLVTFRVQTPGSRTGRQEQIPALLLQQVTRTKDGNYIVRGVDMTKLSGPERMSKAVRHFRVDRILGGIHDVGRVVDSPYVGPVPDETGCIGF